MSATHAVRAVEHVTGQQIDAIRILASGRSSRAWLTTTATATESWVVREPIEDSGRRTSYRAEALIGRHLGSFGHDVADWAVVEIDDISYSVARRLPGVPVAADQPWSPEFGRALAHVLRDLHLMPARGLGPLADDAAEAVGMSTDRTRGIADRWCHAPIWPFDGSSLDRHPIMDTAPAIGTSIARFSDTIGAAASGPIGVVHSDLHREHLLVHPDGTLAGVLDFGDAFIGAVAWDFAVLTWYHGRQNAELVAAHHPDGDEELARGFALALAVGLYKMAKNPADNAVLPRLRRCLDAFTAG